MARAAAIDLGALITAVPIEIPADALNLSVTFYPTKEDQSASSEGTASAGTTTVKVQIPSNEQELPTIISNLASKNRMGVEDQFDALHRARWILSLPDTVKRQQLLACRFLAIAVYSESILADHR